MAMFVTDEGEFDLLSTIRDVANVDWKIGLFTDITPPLDTDTEIGQITPAADTYTLGSTDTPTYGTPTNPAGTQQMIAAPLAWIWASGVGETIQGYYIYNDDTNNLIKVQEFAAPRFMSAPGDTITITDKFTLRGTI